MNSKKTHMIAFLLLVVGGLNWLLFGLIGWEIGAWLGGPDAVASRVLYILIGLAAIYELCTHRASCRHCDTPSTPGPEGDVTHG